MGMKRAGLGHVFLCVCALSLAVPALRAQAPGPFLFTATPQQTADSALQEGKRLLRRGQGDQALSYLETALRLFTAARNNRGIAAAHNELGDLYLRQGQYKVDLEHYQNACQSFSGAQATDEREGAVATSAASRVAGSTAGTAAQTAANVADNGFNANLMLAKIGDTNLRLGRPSEAIAAYLRMNAKKPESAGSRTARRFGGLGGVLGGASTGKVAIAAPVGVGVGLLELSKEFSLYRDSIVYSAYELGLGRALTSVMIRDCPEAFRECL